MKRFRFFRFFVYAVVLVVLGLALSRALPGWAKQTPETRPSEWAKPIRLDGAPNLHRVTRNIYRSAQPTAAGFLRLGNLGVKTVVNLRAFHGDGQRLRGTSLKEIRIRMNAWRPEEDDVVLAMITLLNPDGGPYLVHCMDGADRTGMIIAVYRMVAQGWSRGEAVDEMMNGGYGFHLVWADIFRYLEKLDVAKIRRLAGIPDDRKYDL